MNDFKFYPGLQNESSDENSFYTGSVNGGRLSTLPQKRRDPKSRMSVKAQKGGKGETESSLNHRISMCSVIFGYSDGELKILLLDADSHEGYAAETDALNFKLALPGSLASPDQTLESSARELISELTGDEHFFIEQVYSFGNPARSVPVSEGQSDTWEITVAFFALVNAGESPYISENWYPLSRVKDISLYQQKIVEKALSTLRFEIRHFPIAFELLPEKFTLAQVQSLYEAISGKKLDKRNFRKKLKALNLIIPAGEKMKNTIARPSELFVFNSDVYSDSHNSIFAA